MTRKNNFYITTTLPYVNSKPHIGFALEAVRADAIARYKRLRGFNVFFNSGTDEHGVKIHQKAQELGIDTQDFVDQNAKFFKDLKEKLNLSYDRFIRTTDKDHIEKAQLFWNKCEENGYIYKKKYSGLYCKGCEMFVTPKDLIDGFCKNHPGTQLEEIEEENYFFKYSDFENALNEKYDNNEINVIPHFRLKELQNLNKEGLEDFSISRLKSKMPWGIEVPGDEEHVMYVWFDALVNYISTLGWPQDSNFRKFWQEADVVQYCGKDNIVHQASRWQAMLMAAGEKTSNKVVVNGFVVSDGVKMSKSLGNVIDPVEIIDEYSADALRYYVLRELHPYEDSDFTKEKFKTSYNANLANGIGNLTNRIMKMAEDAEVSLENKKYEISPEYTEGFNEYNLQRVMDYIWTEIGELDQMIQEKEPFKVIKTDKEKGIEIIQELVNRLFGISVLLQPLLPETSENISKALNEGKKPETPLFVRKD